MLYKLLLMLYKLLSMLYKLLSMLYKFLAKLCEILAKLYKLLVMLVNLLVKLSTKLFKVGVVLLKPRGGSYRCRGRSVNDSDMLYPYLPAIAPPVTTRDWATIAALYLAAFARSDRGTLSSSGMNYRHSQCSHWK